MKNLPIVIIIICLSTRLVFFMAIGAWSPIVANEIMPYADPDTLDYHKLAISIVEKHQFVEDGKVETLRVPLYPLFISSFYAIFGEKPWIILLIQIVLDTCSCVLLFFIISRLINYESAFYGSLFYALDPFLIFYSNMLLSDVLFVFICVLAFYFLSKAVSRRPMQSMSVYLLCSAFFFGMATLVRPIAQYIPFVVAFLLLVILIRKVKNALKYSIIFLVVFLIVLSPWLIRNYIMFNVPSLSTSGAYNLVVLYVAPMEAERRGQPTKVVANTLLNEANQLIIRDGLDPNNLNDFVKAKYWQKVAVQYI